MGKIFCLMGKSSTGKDSLFNNLKQDESLGLLPVVPYTTRPKRTQEREGEAYHFITKEQLERYREAGSLIEERVYHTVEGDWHYCTVNDGQIDLDAQSYLLIVTLEAFNSLKAYYGSDQVVPIYIVVEEGERLERAVKRERLQQAPKYEELCRRFIADNKDFEDGKLVEAGITKAYENDCMETCLEAIRKDIIKEVKNV